MECVIGKTINSITRNMKEKLILAGILIAGALIGVAIKGYSDAGAQTSVDTGS